MIWSRPCGSSCAAESKSWSVRPVQMWSIDSDILLPRWIRIVNLLSDAVDLLSLHILEYVNLSKVPVKSYGGSKYPIFDLLWYNAWLAGDRIKFESKNIFHSIKSTWHGCRMPWMQNLYKIWKPAPLTIKLKSVHFRWICKGVFESCKILSIQSQIEN